jgi:protein disulfide-isomerase
MKPAFTCLLTLALICTINLCWGNTAQGNIIWLTNYEEAVNQAKLQTKPMLLFFTGTGWCSACAKLETEVFFTQIFTEAAGNKFIFLKLDFPQDRGSLPSQIVAQNRQLLRKFDVRSFPTVILLDAAGQQQIGITGYRPGGPRQYVSHLMKMVDDYSAYTRKIQNINSPQQLSGLELKQLYEKARALSFDNDVMKIVQAGIHSDQRNYFLLERYRILADEGMIHKKETTELREQLLASDPNNENKTHYEVAVIEFEAYSEGKENASAEHTVAPLIVYAEKFGRQDKENLWRLDMIIAQVFLDKNQLEQALSYARASYESAPASIQPDIALAIKNIQAQFHQ